MTFFDWSQVLALAVFVAIFAARSVLMFVREGTNPFALSAGKAGARWAVEALMPLAIGIWMAALGVSTFGHGKDLPLGLGATIVDADALRATGVALLTVSVALFAWALLSFGSSWRVGIDENAPGKLVTVGVFRVTRNPIFVSMDAFFIGTFLVQGTLFFLLAAVIALVGAHFQILQEESFLSRTYDAAYTRYRAMAPRYLGWPTRGTENQSLTRAGSPR